MKQMVFVVRAQVLGKPLLGDGVVGSQWFYDSNECSHPNVFSSIPSGMRCLTLSSR